MTQPLIVFDLDGTLVETAPDLINALNTIFRAEGIPEVPPVEARTMIGGGLRPFIEKGLQAEGMSCQPEEIDRLFRDMVDHYSAHIADLSHPFPGVVPALDRLEAEGYRFAVCTNKLEGLSVQLLTALDLHRRFAVVCGPDTFGIAKPDPRMLLQTIEAAGGDPRRAVMVGDSNTDITTARAAAIPVIAVNFGYTDRPVEMFGPDVMIDHFDRLPQTVEGILASLRL